MNISPGMRLPVLMGQNLSGSLLHPSSIPLDSLNETIIIQLLTWGLIPSFHVKGEPFDHFRMFNCRSETVLSKPVFSRLIGRNRCVVLLDGYFEWKEELKEKQPYYVRRKDGNPLCIAGIYDSTSCGLSTVTFLTGEVACPDLLTMHQRQPVFLEGSMILQWLDQSLNMQPNDCSAIIREALHYSTSTKDTFEIYPVDKRVNSVQFQGGSECIRPLEQEHVKKIVHFFSKTTTTSSGAEYSITDNTDIKLEIPVTICPVCQQNIHVHSDSALEAHVNTCLDSTQKVSSPTASSVTNKNKKQKTLHSFFG
jgi:putative SOS response-associated peptidase YedK